MSMWNKALAALALAVLCAGTSSPQEAGDVVSRVAKTIGASQVKSLQYSGSGFAYAFGQSYLPGGSYPKFYARYSRLIDFEANLSREETVRTQFENPPRGGGGQPLYRQARAVAVTGENSAWGGRGGSVATRMGKGGDGCDAYGEGGEGQRKARNAGFLQPREVQNRRIRG